jgi:hypothetical protein
MKQRFVLFLLPVQQTAFREKGGFASLMPVLRWTPKAQPAVHPLSSTEEQLPRPHEADDRAGGGQADGPAEAPEGPTTVPQEVTLGVEALAVLVKNNAKNRFVFSLLGGFGRGPRSSWSSSLACLASFAGRQVGMGRRRGDDAVVMLRGCIWVQRGGCGERHHSHALHAACRGRSS